jgi:tRNA(Ile)-lysidine synthase
VAGPPAATAAVRLAVRRALADLPPGGLVLAAVSGGADSLALAAALAFERGRAGALVVDHGLQDGSAAVAARAAGQCRSLGLEPVEVLTAGDGAAGTGDGGPEARARAARYALLESAAARLGAAAVLLGHTLDDQAETVLLGLARGAGARALAGMAAERTPFRRPLLDLPRATTRAACVDAGLQPWDDPHNADPAYARVRVRRCVLPVVERELGPGVAGALARSARHLREDADALDALTPRLVGEPDCAQLAALPAALRARALKGWAERATGRAVTAAHVDALRALVEQWSGQGPVDLPGGFRVRRSAGVLTATRNA